MIFWAVVGPIPGKLSSKARGAVFMLIKSVAEEGLPGVCITVNAPSEVGPATQSSSPKIFSFCPSCNLATRLIESGSTSANNPRQLLWHPLRSFLQVKYKRLGALPHRSLGSRLVFSLAKVREL